MALDAHDLDAHASSHRARPRLTVVDGNGAAQKFSALPHAVLFDKRLSHAARLLYAVLQAHWWQSGACYASHATLAEEMGVSTRMLRTYLDALIAAGLIVEAPHGERRAKSYAPAPIGSTLPIAPVESEAGFSLHPGNRKPVSEQSEVCFRTNEKPVSDSYKKTPEKKTPEEGSPPTGESVAAGAAPEPARPKPPKEKPKATPAPDVFDLTERHFDYARSLGLDEAAARRETDKFLAHHRFKGTRGVDWYAGWQNWMRRAVQYAPPPPQPARRPAATAAHAQQPTPLPAKNVRTY